MAKPEWGVRYVCHGCGCKFYDLNRPEPLCPRCGADPREGPTDARPAPRPARASAAPDEEVENDDLDESVEVVFESDAILQDDEDDDDEDDEDY